MKVHKERVAGNNQNMCSMSKFGDRGSIVVQLAICLSSLLCCSENSICSSEECTMIIPITCTELSNILHLSPGGTKLLHKLHKLHCMLVGDGDIRP